MNHTRIAKSTHGMSSCEEEVTLTGDCPQGDPISPLMLVFVQELLIRILLRDCGDSITVGETNVVQQCFVDDLSLVDAKFEGLKEPCTNLTLLYAAIGCRVNFSKCFLTTTVPTNDIPENSQMRVIGLGTDGILRERPMTLVPLRPDEDIDVRGRKGTSPAERGAARYHGGWFRHHDKASDNNEEQLEWAEQRAVLINALEQKSRTL